MKFFKNLSFEDKIELVIMSAIAIVAVYFLFK